MKNYVIQTFGCAMNTADSERFRTILNNLGLTETDNIKEADLIVFNSCSIREKAEDRIYGLKPLMTELKLNNPSLITVLTGCMARRRIDKEASKPSREEIIKRKAKWLDLVIETQNFHKIAEYLNQITAQNEQDSFLDVKREPFQSFTAGITISHGCDHLCSYCIVPYARGREICRRAEPIIEEAEEAIQNGARELILLGQTVNRWINPQFKQKFIHDNLFHTRIENINAELMKPSAIDEASQPKDFMQLLQSIDNLKGDFWLTFMSSHPNYFTQELIEYIADSVRQNRHIKPHIHLALQSGSNEILQKMRRDHTIEEFTQKILLMKNLIPSVAITTDIIVGFPSETQAQFEGTLNICRELEFDQIFISEYSEREGTGSSYMEDNITNKEKAERKDILNEVLRITALNNNQKMINTSQKVLITKLIKEGIDHVDHIYQGKTANGKLIRVLSNKKLPIGDFVMVDIKSATAWSLKGEVL